MKKTATATLLLAMLFVNRLHATTYAVVVGVSTYDTPKRKLNYAADDARAVYSFLVNSFGIEPENVSLLTDSDAPKQVVLAEMRRQFANATADDVVLFFYSGHGCSSAFVPYDSQTEDWIEHRQIREIFKSCKAGKKMCIADACHSGAINSGRRHKAGQASATNSTASEVVIFMSSRDTGISKEIGTKEKGNGIFTYYLLEAISGSSDADGNGEITYRELYYYVRDGVRKATKNRQTPVMYGKFRETDVLFSKK